jgi:molybdopterin-binding protein
VDHQRVDRRRGGTLVAALTTYSADELSLRVGDAVFYTFKATAVHLC